MTKQEALDALSNDQVQAGIERMHGMKRDCQVVIGRTRKKGAVRVVSDDLPPGDLIIVTKAELMAVRDKRGMPKR